MTAVCGGGTSAAKTGFNETIIATSAYLAALLESTSAWWVAPALSLLGVSTYDLTTFCASDPPAMPTLTVAESQALLSLTPGADLASALGKLPAIAANALWYANCQCTSGPQPTAPQPPIAPGAVVPGLLPVMAGEQTPSSLAFLCAGGGATSADASQTVYGVTWSPKVQTVVAEVSAWGLHNPTWATEIGVWRGNKLWFRTGAVTLNWDTMYHWPLLPFVANPGDQLTVACVGMPAGTAWCHPGAGCADPAAADPYFTAGTLVRAASSNLVLPTLTTLTAGTFLDLWHNPSAAAIAATSCCPDLGTVPDLAPLYSKLADLATQVQTVTSLVTTVQRNLLPFAYIVGASHVGLTGSGTIAISRLVGVRVTVTAYPLGNRVQPGEPPYIFDLGWISVMDPDGMIDEKRISRTTQEWFSRLTPLSTVLGYSFNTGVTATITELQPEP